MQQAVRRTLRGGAHLLRRDFSSTPCSSFFFRRPTSASPQRLVQDLNAARTQDRLDLVMRLYPNLVESLGPSSSASHRQLSFDPDDIRRLLRYVASTTRFTLTLRIFSDLPLFGLTATGDDHQSVLIGFLTARKPGKALKWIESMQPTYGLTPTVSLWNVVLNGFQKIGDMKGMQSTMAEMRKRGIAFDVVTYNTLITATFELGTIDEVRELTKEMAADGLEGNVKTESALLSGFVEAGELGSARQVKERLLPLVSAHSLRKGKWNQSDDRVDIGVINCLIKFEAVDAGYEEALKLAESYRDQGFPLNTRTVNTLALTAVARISSAADAAALLEELEDSTGVKPDRRAWSSCIVAVLKQEGWEQAYAVYSEARDRSVLPDSAMIQPFLDALLVPSARSATTFDLVKTLYEDLSTSSKAHSNAPDISVYITLLRACADPHHPDIPFSKQILDDMRQQGIRLESETVTWHIVALMRVAASYREAFAAYDNLRAAHVDALAVSGYNIILAAFTSLSFPDGQPAPPPIIAEFLSDMRTSGHPPNTFTYSTLLTHFSRAGDPTALSAISRIHSLIKLDSNLDPDTALFNSLLGAYSRLAAYDTAYGIWESMRATVGINERSVSIILDTLGHDQSRMAESRGRKVWEMVKQEKGLKLGYKVWDSYVEFLCRHGHGKEAEDVVLREMGAAGVEVAKSTLETLLKFSMSNGRWEELRKKMQIETPAKWKLVENLTPRELEGKIEASGRVVEPSVGRF